EYSTPRAWPPASSSPTTTPSVRRGGGEHQRWPGGSGSRSGSEGLFPTKARASAWSFRKEDESMKADFAESALAVALLTGAALAARAQEIAQPKPEAPKEVKAVRSEMRVLEPLKPAVEWAGYVPNPKLRAAASEADHVISDAAAWAKLWGAW